MSHVSTIDIEIKDLDALKQAAKTLGLEMREATTYKWYGQSVGDYPLPPGFKKSELGKCEYALYLPGNDQAYEIGVTRSKTGEGYTLLYDFWNGGFGLMKAVSTDGKTLNLLKTEYGVETSIKALRRRGYNASVVRENGKVKVVGRAR